MKKLFFLIFLFSSSVAYAQVAGTPPEFTCPASQWVDELKGSDNPACTQPAFSDISGTASTSQLPEAAADGTTKGIATFTANDFNITTGNVSIDYTNAQKATTSTIGFLTDTDWDTFNNKQATITWGAGLAYSAPTASTDSSEAGFLSVGALACGAGTAGKTLVHTTPLQYCDNTATPTLRYSAYGDSSGNALTGDSATGFFSLGTLEDARLPSSMADKTLTGTTNISGAVIFGGVIRPANITTQQNNYNPTGLSTASVLHLTTTGNQSISGIAGGVDGRTLVIFYDNTDTSHLDFINESTASSAANRFSLPLTQNPDGHVFISGRGNGIVFMYDGTAARWKPIKITEVNDTCELIVNAPSSATEYNFCESPYITRSAWGVRCECYGTCSTPPTIKICVGEDTGDDTCTTNLLSTTESETLTCSTAGGEDLNLNPSAGYFGDTGLTVVVTNSPSAATYIKIVIAYIYWN